MKTFKFLNKKLTIKLEDVKENESIALRKAIEEENKENFIVKILILIFIMSSFVFLGKFYFFQEKYKVGDIAKKDVIAPFYTEFNDKLRKEEAIKNIILDSPKLYKRKDNVEHETINTVDTFFGIILKLNNKTTNFEISNIIKETGVGVSINEIRKLIDMKKSEKEELKRKIITVIKGLYARGIKEDEILTLKKIINNFDSSLSEIEKELIMEFIIPNEYYDEKATVENQKEKINALEDIIIKINPGDIIISKGEEITLHHIEILKHLGLYSNYYSLKIVFGVIIYLVVVSLIFFLLARKFIKEELSENKYFYSTLILILIMFIFAKLIPLKWMYIYPFGVITLILGLIINEKYSIILSSIILLYILVNQGFDYLFLLLAIFDILVCIYFMKKIKNRSDLINVGISIGIINSFLIISSDLILKKEILDIFLNFIQAILSGILTGMISIAILPYLENTFNILTNIKLIELSDFSHPLLKDLMLKTPGTFHHSILVSTLAEHAAEAVGANSLFTRAAAYYHDIGKTKRPHFYVENQYSGVNPHENLNPYLSTLVISSHTTDGEEMAKKYKIPKEIRDIIKEHQGTTLLAYFYNKAKKENPEVNEMDFRYEGPKPKTKESAIIMLADSVEAAVRSINEKDRNPVSIENMVRQIVKSKIEDGQLSDADLTFKNIETIIETFTKVLQGIYHVRLKYPDLKKTKKE